jgi:hypothetical protein
MIIFIAKIPLQFEINFRQIVLECFLCSHSYLCEHGTWANHTTFTSPIVALSHVLSLRRDENDLPQQTLSYGEYQQNYEDTPNIGVIFFIRVTERLLERNRDIFKSSMDFHSPSGYFWSPGS